MRFNSNVIYHHAQTDHIVPSMNGGKTAPVKKYAVYRMVLGADAWVKFVDTPAIIPADGTEGELLKSGIEYFINSGDNQFVSFSRVIVTASDNVVEVV